MSRKWIGLFLGLTALAGLAVVATAQVGTSFKQEYDQAIEKLDKNKVDDVYALAKKCFLNGMAVEAMGLAQEARVKAPDDVRLKYLMYALNTAETDTGTETGGEGGGDGGIIKPVVLTITDTQADAVFKREGDKQMEQFKAIESMLVLKCGSLKCHGGVSEKAKYGLLRQGLGSRKTMAQNFLAISPHLNRDKDKAAESRLLQVPLTGMEGRHKVVLRTTTDTVYIKTRDWIASLKTAGEMIFGKSGKK